MTSWSVRGSYFESCNCEVICPCRRVDGVPGGRSTHGVCTGILTWQIDEGEVGDTALDGLSVALAFRYDDDEPGSPWRWILYLDERGDDAQREALEGIFTGRLAGDAQAHFPWAWKPADLLAVAPVRIEVDHTPRRQWLRIRDRVTVRIHDRHPGPETVSCVIPGHDRSGEELVVEQLRVDDVPFALDLHGTCGYAARFAYTG